MKLTWFGHSSVKLETGGKIIYIDPYAGPEEWYSPAHVVLVSRFHFDHCNTVKLRRALNDTTKIVGTSDVAREIYPVDVMRAGEKKIIEEVEISGMPVTNPHMDVRRHDEDIEALGFLVNAENKKIFFMADSDYLPEFKDMKPDVLLIAVGGTYTADPKEAAEIAALISPKLAIPIHWGGVVGTRDDADYFKELARFPVKVLEPGESVEV